MPERTTAAPQVHLHWVRETPSRALDLPFSSTFYSLEALPPCVQIAVRATGLSAVEVHLPIYRPSLVPDLDSWLASLQFRQDAVGRLIGTRNEDPDPFASMAAHQATLLVLRAVTGDTTPLTLVADPGPAPILSRPLATRHRCTPNSGGLAKAPAERSTQYARVYKELSAALQCVLRQALPSVHLESLTQFDDRQHTLSLLAWSAAEPVNGRHVDELGVDVFNPKMLNRALDGLSTRLAAKLAEVHDILARHHADPLICKSYHPSEAVRIARDYRRRTRYLFLLFANEVRLITGFVQFCTRIGKWRETAQGNPASVYREVRDSWEEVEVLIRRLYKRHRHSSIGSAMLLEAVRTLEAVD